MVGTNPMIFFAVRVGASDAAKPCMVVSVFMN
jgi:hypothetical protein